MELISISDNIMINVDLIESLEMRKDKKGAKSIVLTIGGKQYTPEIETMKILERLIKSGVSKSTNQFFSV